MPNKSKSKQVVVVATAQQPKKSSSKKNARPRKNLVKSVTVSAPITMGTIVHSKSPKISTRKGKICVSHREYLGELTGVASTTANKFYYYAVNPGIAASFPWLSRLSVNYERYTMKKLRYIYEPQAPTTQAGTVVMSFDFDSADSNETGKSVQLNDDSSCRASVWSPLTLDVKPKLPKQIDSLFMRTSSLSANQDIKTYDVGKLNIGIYGTNSANVMGDLSVEYDVEYYVAQLGNAQGGASLGGSYSGTSGAAPVSVVTGNVPVTVVSTFTGGTITITYTFTQQWSGYISWVLVGTGLGTPTANGGTVTFTDQGDVVNAGDTASISTGFVSAQNAQTIILQNTATTVSNSQMSFGQSTV